MRSDDINSRVEKIKDDEREISLLIEEYKPFIASCAEKVTGRYVRYGEDDELSIALMAFAEAIKSYSSAKGSFLAFARNVIARRLIDYYRKERRYSNVISLNEYCSREDDEEMDLSIGQSVEMHYIQEAGEYRRLEIEELKKELSGWGITFFDLAETSPKHGKTKKNCADIIKYLLSRDDLIKLIKEKKYLPVGEIEEALGLPRKKIERLRKYIIALILILTGDYEYIKDYINI